MRRQSSGFHCPGKRLSTKRRKRESITFTLAVALLLFCTGFVSWCEVDFSEKVSAQPLVSSVFAVNSTEDPGSGLVNCSLRGFKCTLRAAISAANLASGDDTITFAIPTSDPNCNSSGQCTINLTSQLPDLGTNINITGPGQNNLTVRRNTGGFYRIFNVTTEGAVSLSGMTISNGDADSGGGVQNVNTGTVHLDNCLVTGNVATDGGAIHNAARGTVTITNSVISNNDASIAGGVGNLIGFVNIGTSSVLNNRSHRFGGGGVHNNGGMVAIVDSTISNNSAAGGGGGGISNLGTGSVSVIHSVVSNNVQSFDSGGGIYNPIGTVEVTRSEVRGNSAPLGGGGGIDNGGTLDIRDSTISGNTSSTDLFSGGGLNNEGTANVTNSTFSGNSALTEGGAIANSGTLTVANSTISLNSATGTQHSDGNAGISTRSPGISRVKSSIIALNSSPRNVPDVSGSFISGGFNLIGKRDGSSGFTQPTDQTGTIALPLDPKLDPGGLKDNGGETRTIALLPNSPAIDKATSIDLTGSVLTTDQRGTGFPRTDDDSAVSNAAGGDGTDVGAFEVHPGPVRAAGSILIDESCPPTNGMIDPGETATVNLRLLNIGATSTTNLVATLQPSANVLAPSGPQIYGAISPNDTGGRDFTFTANGNSGDLITLTLQLQDGPTNLGNVTYSFTLGSNTACAGAPRIRTSTLLSCNNGNTVAAITISNSGTATANAVTLTTANLGGISGAPLPQFIGSLAPGVSATITITFTGAPTGSTTLQVGGAYTGGTFNSNRTVTAPTCP